MWTPLQLEQIKLYKFRIGKQLLLKRTVSPQEKVMSKTQALRGWIAKSLSSAHDLSPKLAKNIPLPTQQC
jgi:hypothetical protein